METEDLLIAPEGIEMQICFYGDSAGSILLIAPEGIEISKFNRIAKGDNNF